MVREKFCLGVCLLVVACDRGGGAAVVQEPAWLNAPVSAAAVRALEAGAGGRPISGGPRVSLAPGYDPYEGRFLLGQPLRYARAGAGTLPLEVDYFLSLPDSVTRVVLYEWERQIPASDDFDTWLASQLAEDRRCSEYAAVYERVARWLTARLGTPEQEDSGTVAAAKTERTYQHRKTHWARDSARADLSMTCGANTHRVRARLYWGVSRRAD